MLSGQVIFITGGAGFIGSRLVEKLVDDNEIVVLDIMARDSLSGKECANHKNLRVVEGDVMDRETVRKAISGATYVVHCAGIAGIDTVIKRPTKTLAVNIMGTLNVLEEALSLKDLKRLVCFSTSEVFGSHALSAKESDTSIIGAAGHARWTYAVSKLAEEHMALAYFQEYDMPTSVIRPFNVYGPGQIGEGALKIFIQRALKNEPITIYGDGNQIRAWCYVDDMINGILKVLSHPAAVGESFNIGNARSVLTIFGLANTIIRVLKSESKINFAPPLSADIELRIPDVSKSKELIAFEPLVGLEDGIIRTADFYRQSQ